MPADEELQAEAVQEVWLSLVEAPKSMDMAALYLLVRQKVEKVQRASARWYALTVPEVALPEAGEDIPDGETPGSMSGNPMEQSMERESYIAKASARDAALARLQRAIPLWTEAQSERVLPGVRTGLGPGTPKACSSSASALLAREALTVTGWQHADLCRYLGVSQSLLREVLYRNAEFSEAGLERLRDLIQMQVESRQWDWPQLIADGCQSTGKNEVAFCKYLAGIMGVHPRTLRRWVQGAFGSKKNLQLALAVRSRGWKR